MQINGTFLEIVDTADGEIEVANTTSDPSSAYIYFYNLGNSSKFIQVHKVSMMIVMIVGQFLCMVVVAYHKKV